MEYSRRTVRLRRTGGSRAVVLPKAWLRRIGARDEVDIVETDQGIRIEAVRGEPASIEDDPAFGQFLAFLLQDSLEHPERLGDVGQLTRDAEDLFRGVEAG